MENPPTPTTDPAMDSPKREHLVYQARLAEQATRFEDMVVCMIEVAKLGCGMSHKEVKLLSGGYKSVIGVKLTSLRSLASINEAKAEATKYSKKVEGEIETLCYDVNNVVDNYLLPHFSSAECTVLYHKLKADSYWYLSELKERDVAQFAELARKSYEVAFQLAKIKLSPACPTRLELSLNLSIFYNDIMRSSQRAYLHAQDAVMLATPGMTNLNEKDRRYSKVLIETLEQNLKSWTTDSNNPTEGEKGERWRSATGKQCCVC